MSNKKDESYIDKRHTNGKKYMKNAEQSKKTNKKKTHELHQFSSGYSTNLAIGTNY